MLLAVVRLSLQLTPHLHLLLAEAQWEVDGTVVPVAPPGDEDVARILSRVLRETKRDWAELDAAWPVAEFEELQHQAIQERLGFHEASASRHRARRPAVLHGFSLHADTTMHGNDRQGLERLCRYGARGPVAKCRLRRLDDGATSIHRKRELPSPWTTSSPTRCCTSDPDHTKAFWATLGAVLPDLDFRRAGLRDFRSRVDW